jgi:hypothetical protein
MRDTGMQAQSILGFGRPGSGRRVVRARRQVAWLVVVLLIALASPATAASSDALVDQQKARPAPKAPDLVVVGVTGLPANGEAGTSFQATDTTRNEGQARSAASRTAYYLSQQSTVGSTAYLLAPSRAVKALGPGKESLGSVALTVPADVPPGDYHLIACADADEVIAESDESNNCSSAPTTMRVAREAGLECSVRSLTPDDGFDPFYGKGCVVDSFWTVASSEVRDSAVKRAGDIAIAMLDGLTSERQSLVSRHIRLGVIGVDEVTTDLPEYSDLYDVFPGVDWDATRGLGATLARPLVSAGEENLLCLSGDPYAGESILVHEFAHTILDHGIVPTRLGFRTRLETAYASAMEAGIWDNTYAATNADEYWAEAVQSYFDVNLHASPPDGIHGPIGTREALAEADPAVHDLIREVWGDRTVEAGCP